MFVADDDELCAQARFLAAQAREPAPHYEHRRVGHNYRLSNLLAALGRSQLRTLSERVAARQQVNRYYRAALADVPGLSFMPVASYGEPNFWLTCILLDDEFGGDTDSLRLALAADGIESRPTWKPMHLQPLYRSCPVRGGRVAADIFERGLCLPSGSNLTESDLQRVVDVIRATAPGLGGGRRLAQATGHAC
jgi:dTDP-4-amino-4,6-dideoxygalactose transaminase